MSAVSPPAPRFRMGRYWAALAIIAILALWPPAVASLAHGLAAAGHCHLAEAAPTSCSLLGMELGGPLWSLSTLGDATVFSLPAGITLLLVWLVVVGVNFAGHTRRHRTNPGDAGPVNFAWYGAALVAILLVAYATLAGWVPGVVLLVLVFATIFWLFSFIFALIAAIRRSRIKT